MGWLDDLLDIDPATAGAELVIDDGPARTAQDDWHPADRVPVLIDDDVDGWF